LYYSAGIAVEAQVIAKKLKPASGRVVQLVANDAVARAGAAAIRLALAPNAGQSEPVSVIDIEAGSDVSSTRSAIAALGPRDALVLWLRPTELIDLSNFKTTQAQIFVSATLGGGEQLDLPKTLRAKATLVQPMEEPHMRAANVERFKTWLEGSQVPLVDLRLQSEVFFATGSLQSTLRGMLNNLHTDYLIERAESTLSSFEAMQVQEEIQAMMMGPMNKRPLQTTPPSAEQVSAHSATTKAQMAHLEEMRMRGGTTVYPRLSLAQGQRFASKGAYLERLNPEALGITGEPEWVVP
jgi:hypothetical protein